MGTADPQPHPYKIKKSVKNVRAILLLSLFSPIASQDDDLGSLFMGHSKKKHNLPTELREKHFLTLSDTRILQEQLWRNDWYNYKHERYRVQNSGAIVLFVCTSGRVGEFSESSAYAGSGRGLCYKVSQRLLLRKRSGTSLGASTERSKHAALPKTCSLNKPVDENCMNGDVNLPSTNSNSVE